MKDETDSKIEKFFTSYPATKFNKKRTVLNSEEQPRGVYYLKTGYIRMYTITQEGFELTLNILKPGSFFPLTWAIADIDNAYFYETLTTCEIHSAPKDRVIKFVKKNNDILFDINRRILSGLDATLIRLQYLTLGSAYQRVANSFLMLAGRFGVFLKDRARLTLTFTEQDVANLAGVTRETVSIELKKLKNEGFIKKDKGFYSIYKIDELREGSLIYYEGKALPYAF
jgi:CRP-like cAMP-binding protein